MVRWLAALPFAGTPGPRPAWPREPIRTSKASKKRIELGGEVDVDGERVVRLRFDQ